MSFSSWYTSLLWNEYLVFSYIKWSFWYNQGLYKIFINKTSSTDITIYFTCKTLFFSTPHLWVFKQSLFIFNIKIDYCIISFENMIVSIDFRTSKLHVKLKCWLAFIFNSVKSVPTILVVSIIPPPHHTTTLRNAPRNQRSEGLVDGTALSGVARRVWCFRLVFCFSLRKNKKQRGRVVLAGEMAFWKRAVSFCFPKRPKILFCGEFFCVFLFGMLIGILEGYWPLIT